MPALNSAPTVAAKPRREDSRTRKYLELKERAERAAHLVAEALADVWSARNEAAAAHLLAALRELAPAVYRQPGESPETLRRINEAAELRAAGRTWDEVGAALGPAFAADCRKAGRYRDAFEVALGPLVAEALADVWIPRNEAAAAHLLAALRASGRTWDEVGAALGPAFAADCRKAGRYRDAFEVALGPLLLERDLERETRRPK